MRFLRSMVAWVGLGVGATGCVDYCDIGDCQVVASGGGGAGGATTSTGGGSVGGSGGGGGLPTDCTPTEGVAIPATCGVFVMSGASGEGTQASPFGSVVEASTSLGSAKAIYVCGGDTFAGSVALPGGVSIFGGLDCATWTYSKSAAHPKLVGDANVPALKLSGAGSSALLSLDIEAPPGVAEGASSIALLVSDATVNVDESDIKAGDGANGAMPAAPPGQMPAAPGGGMGTDASMTSTLANANGGMNTCGATSLGGGVGGKGGDHSQVVKDGGNGAQGDAGSGGTNGLGESAGAWSCVPGQGLGIGGGNSAPGMEGSGATSLGSLTSNGFTPAAGDPGAPGQHGTSGGGGGGSKASTTVNGAGGGAGGAGGCGGIGGVPGAGGGSSLALVSINATVTLSSTVALHVAAGGDGGQGGDGQFGQGGGPAGLGGALGSGVAKGCNGGDGGGGGNGGNAGGGRGGHAIAIAFSGTEPTGGTRDLAAAIAGNGGPGGDNGGNPGGTGDSGLVAESQVFP